VWDSDRFGRNQFLGEVRIPLASLDLTMSSSEWYNLQDKVHVYLYIYIVDMKMCYVPAYQPWFCICLAGAQLDTCTTVKYVVVCNVYYTHKEPFAGQMFQKLYL
jgi:hypothetical protein